MEEFKDIKGYGGKYKVSNRGRVKSLAKSRELILKNKMSDRYPCVNLYSENGKCKTRRVHQLVAEAFLGHTTCGFKMVVDHIDGDRTNNDVSNLRVVDAATNVHNKKDREFKYTSIHRGVSFCEIRNKWKVHSNVHGRYRYIGSYETEGQAAEASRRFHLDMKAGIDSNKCVMNARRMFKK